MIAQKKFPRMSVYVAVVLTSVLLCEVVHGQRKEPFSYSIATDKNKYALGESITVTCTLKNVSVSPMKIQKWRGLLAGVGRSKPDEFDFAVYRIKGDELERVDYQGMFACGPPSYMILKASEVWQNTYTINNFLFPAYSLTEPGEYLLRSNYFSSPYKENSDAFKGTLRAEDVKIKVVKLSSRELGKIRKQLSEGKTGAISIAALHHDHKAVSLFSKFCSNEDPTVRRRAHKAFSVIDSNKAMHALGNATLTEPDYSMRIEITRLLADSNNLVAVPYLKRLLDDNYKSVIGKNGKRYYQYTVRKWASEALNKLGVKDNTTYLEELKEEIEIMPSEQRNALFENALSGNHNAQFEAVRQLAIKGYSPKSAQILLKLACESRVPETTRDYAAMGLGNFTNAIPSDEKAAMAQELRAVLVKEKLNIPDGIIRLLGKWGDAVFIFDTFGDQFKGHPLEIDVLSGLKDDRANDRLWQIYQQCPKLRKSEYYSKRAKIGRALAGKGDIRGIDILITLLPADAAPGPQYRNNVYCFIALKIGNNFGYEDGNYRPELEEAMPKMISWWEQNRSIFRF